MALYRDSDRDSELRIAAYLAVMKCPNSYFISQIKQTLASEEVNQVNIHNCLFKLHRLKQMF